MSHIERLDWDSRFFGYEIGKLEIEKGEEFDSNWFLKNAGAFRLVYIFSKMPIHFDKSRAVGTKTIFARGTAQKETSEGSFELKSFDKDRQDYTALEKLALESGKYSRFKTDPGFDKGEYQRLYKKWIENSVKGKLAFDVIVAESGDEIQGFVSLSKKTGDTAKIGLIAVGEKARKLGIASALISEALRRSGEKGFLKLEVATQNENLPAMELYKKNGFEIEEEFFVYHYWNKNSFKLL